MQWEDDNYCYACGKNNPLGLKLNFLLKGKKITTEVKFKKEHQGYKNIVHGGFIALVLDEVMVNLPYRLLNSPVVSADLNIKLKKPAPIDTRIVFSAEIEKEYSKVFLVKGKAVSNNILVAEGTSKCIKIT